MMLPIRTSALSLVITVSLFFSDQSQVLAQSLSDTEATQRQLEQIQRQEQERLQRDWESIRSSEDEIKGIDTDQIKPGIAVPEMSAHCQRINEIIIEGVASLSEKKIQKIVGKYESSCLTADRVQQLLSDLTNAYMSAGMITTRAYLPPQDLSDGVLDILVLEGIVEKITIEDGNAKSISVNNILPFAEGKALNLRDFEQGIDQINRLKSNQAKLDFLPGSRPGASEVVIRNQPQRAWFFNFSTDNEGSESTGKLQSAITGITENPLGFNERISLNYRQSTFGDPDSQMSDSATLSFNIPAGYFTFSAGFSRSGYASEVGLSSGLNVISEGENDNDFVRVDRVLYRDASRKASLSAKLTKKRSKNYLDGQFLSVSSRNLTVLDLDANVKFRALGGAFSVDLGYAEGLRFLNALRDPDDMPQFVPRAQFRKIKAGISYSSRFKLFRQNLSFTSSIKGQKAQTALFGSEQITVGGLYTVRGFNESSLSGEDGYYWRNDLSLNKPFAVLNQTVQSRYYIGMDTGRVSTDESTVPDGHLSGVATGFALNWRGASIDMSISRAIDKPADMQRESGLAMFRLSYNY